MNKLLLVEDEEVILKALRRLLERNRYEVHCAGSVHEAMSFPLHSFDLILADLRLPGELGTTLIEPADPVPVVIMTSHASVRSAVDAMRHGAIDYIAKPFDHDELLIVIQRSLHQNRMHAQNQALKLDVQRHHPLDHYVHDTELSSILKSVKQHIDKQRFVYLYGESGTERESIAKAIHIESENHEGPLLVLDVSDDHEQMTSLLFGTSQAMTIKPNDLSTLNAALPNGGYLQAAQNGTLVIRNLDRLSSDAQLSLCKAFEQGIPTVFDGDARKANNVQLICINDSALHSCIDNHLLVQEFAELFDGNEFEVPPLRTRPNDIKTLVKRQLQRLAQRYGWEKLSIDTDALTALEANQWPGNVAELESVLNHAVFSCRTNTLTINDLEGRDLNLDEYFRYFVLRNQAKLSETELAARLGISRKALWERRQKMQLLRDRPNNAGD